MSDCILAQHSLGIIALSCKCVSNLYILLCVFKLFKIIKSPALRKKWSVIHFLSSRNLFAADIHQQICKVHRATAMCKGTVYKWVRDFKASWDCFDCGVLDYSLYSLDLMVNDFHLFSISSIILAATTTLINRS